MLSVQKKQIAPDVTALELAGKITIGRSAQQLEWEMDELLAANARKVILDLSAVEHIDSTGIGIIVLCSGKMKNAGGELRVSGAQGLVSQVLTMTKVDAIVGMYPNTGEALRGFGTGAGKG